MCLCVCGKRVQQQVCLPLQGLWVVVLFMQQMHSSHVATCGHRASSWLMFAFHAALSGQTVSGAAGRDGLVLRGV